MGELDIVDLIDEDFNLSVYVFGFDDFFKHSGRPRINHYCFNEFLENIFEAEMISKGLGGVLSVYTTNMDDGWQNYFSFIEEDFFNYMGSRTDLYFENIEEVGDFENGLNIAYAKKELDDAQFFNESMDVKDIISKYSFLENSLYKSKIHSVCNKKILEEIVFQRDMGYLKDFDGFNNYLLKIYGLEKYVVSKF